MSSSDGVWGHSYRQRQGGRFGLGSVSPGCERSRYPYYHRSWHVSLHSGSLTSPALYNYPFVCISPSVSRVVSINPLRNIRSHHYYDQPPTYIIISTQRDTTSTQRPRCIPR